MGWCTSLRGRYAYDFFIFVQLVRYFQQVIAYQVGTRFVWPKAFDDKLTILKIGEKDIPQFGKPKYRKQECKSRYANRNKTMREYGMNRLA